MRIAVVGVGLIGGSVALAARARGATVTGFDPAGVREGVVDAVAGSAREAVADAEIVVVAAPVSALPAAVGEALSGSDAVVTDVGSTKRALVEAVDHPRFVGGHPLAGAETAGAAHARADLFAGATWYLTPTARTEGVAYDRLYRFLSELGARPQAIDAETHDTVMAAVSHLPHVLANVLVAQAARALDAEGERLPPTGPSFRDATRVAGAPTAIWRDIYLANADALGTLLDDTIARLGRVREALAAGDGDEIATWNDHAGDERRRLLDAHLSGAEMVRLRVSVPNRPGVVAEVALALGRSSVNIVDMALHPAADNASGTIELEVSEEQAATAQQLIAALDLPVISSADEVRRGGERSETGA
jgi:prephenate dehydrogenase